MRKKITRSYPPDPNVKQKICRKNELCVNPGPQPIENFNFHKPNKDGYYNICKVCAAEENKPYQKKFKRINAKRLSEETIERNNRSPETRQARRDYSQQYSKEYPEVAQASASLRRARKLERTPNWLTEDDLRFIKLFFKESTRLSIETGIPHDVDHIVPLKGKYMSGLHVPWNLRVITEQENLKRTKHVEPFFGKEPTQ